MVFFREPLWDGDDAATLRQFLNTATGRRLLDRLVWLRPSPPVVVEPTTRLVFSGELSGFERALSTLVSLVHPPVSSPQSKAPLPDLDNDGEWKTVDEETLRTLRGE
jgi:hypothetical protein